MIQASITHESLKRLVYKLMDGEKVGLAYKEGLLYFGSDAELPEDFDETILLRTEKELCSLIFKAGQIESFSVLLKEVPIESSNYKIIIKNDTEIKGFKSQTEVANYLGCVPSTVSKAIKTKKRIKGWLIEKRG